MKLEGCIYTPSGHYAVFPLDYGSLKASWLNRGIVFHPVCTIHSSFPAYLGLGSKHWTFLDSSSSFFTGISKLLPSSFSCSICLLAFGHSSTWVLCYMVYYPGFRTIFCPYCSIYPDTPLVQRHRCSIYASCFFVFISCFWIFDALDAHRGLWCILPLS